MHVALKEDKFANDYKKESYNKKHFDKNKKHI
jgi:hypothetical protein